MSLSARAVAVLAVLLPSLGATTITVLPALTIAQATEERDSWLSENFGPGTTAQSIEPNLQQSRGKLQLLTSFYNLFFFMTDLEGTVLIRTADGTSAHVHGNDSGVYFVGITSSASIGSVEWRGNKDFELTGFGIPQEPNPEPATWLVVASGLALMLVLGRFRFTRRYKGPSAPSPAARSIWRSAILSRRLRATLRRHSPARP